jgi:hypothetical protein
MSLTICAGLINYEEAEADLAAHQTAFAGFRKVWQAGSTEPAPQLSKKDVQEADNFYRYMALSCKGRSFFVTKGGYFGLGPLISQAEDECHIFKGARVPFVLRPADNGAYRLVAETYLHGVMRGEHVAAGDIKWRKTVLC